MDIYDIIALATGLMSVFLGIFAVLLAIHQKKEADKVNEKTIDLLIDVKTDANTVSKIAIPELKEYGKSMRRLIFREEKDNQNLELENIGDKIEKAVTESMNIFNLQIDEIKEEILSNSESGRNSAQELNRIKEQLDKLKKIAIQSEEEIRKDIKEITDDIEVDLSAIGESSFKVSHGYFVSVFSFLKKIYLDFMQKHVPAWTYGRTWILRNKRTNSLIQMEGERHDTRNLKDANILPGDTLELIKIEKQKRK